MTAQCGMAAGKQLLNLGRDPVGIGEPGRVVRAIELNHARAGNVIGEIPARLHRNGGVISGMENECRHSDRRQDWPDIGPESRFERRPRPTWAGAHALEHSELAH